MRLLSLAALAAAAAAAWPPLPFNCSVSPAAFTCYEDTPVRALSYLSLAADASLTVEVCAARCAADGFPVSGLTANPSPAPRGVAFCYCGATVAPGAVPAPRASCAQPCPGDGGETCGGLGATAVWPLTGCAPLPPAPVGPPLPAGAACSQAAARALPFCDAALDLDTRVDDLVGRLSLTEIAEQLQARSSAPVPRLGLPGFYWGSNNIHGISGSNCRASTGRCPVSWPDGVAMAASYNETAWRLMGRTAGIELRALYNLLYAASPAPALGLTSWGPTINLLRDTRWGRSQESASECPFVAGVYGAAVSAGLQTGDDPRFLLAVSGLKHFAAYSLEQYGPPSDPAEWTRQTFNAIVSTFDAADSYFPPFKAAIQVGGAAGVMYAANEFNGVPGCLSDYLRSVLAEWGFDGYRCTDGGQISQAVALHKFVPTLDQAIAYAAVAQSDIADGDEYAAGGLLHAFLNGNVSLPQARTLLRNAMRVRFRLGLFESPPPYAQYGDEDIGAPAAWAAAALASREGLVLLANRGRALPLTPGAAWARPGALAVIGPNANSTLLLQGNYGGAYCPNGAHGPATDCYPSIFTALRTYAPGATLTPGSNMASGDAGMIAAAVAAARGADAAVLCLGLDQTQEREQLDRYNITLPAAQQALFDAVAAALEGSATRLIVVLVHGGMLAVPAIKARADAILDALYPGVRGGEAVADALFGAFSPGGKMPYTTYAPTYAAQYNFTNMSIAAPQAYIAEDGSEQMTPGGRTYRYYRGGDELWPFAFGLSYTNFTLAWAPPAPPATLTLTPAAPNASVAVVLANAGTLDGDEVVFLFAEPTPGSFAARPPPFTPVRSLVAFARRSLSAGGRATLTFDLTAVDAFALTQDDGSRAPIDGGAFTLVVSTGPAQPNISVAIAVRTVGWP